MTDPNPTQPGGRHAEKMARFVADTNATLPHEGSAKFHIVAQLIDYTNDLASQLEAERSHNAFVLTEQTSGIENERDLWWAYRDATKELKAAEEKLRAAEAVVEAARHFAACDNAKGWVLCWDATRQALSAFDAINPDGSRGGAGEGASAR